MFLGDSIIYILILQILSLYLLDSIIVCNKNGRVMMIISTALRSVLYSRCANVSDLAPFQTNVIEKRRLLKVFDLKTIFLECFS